MAMGRWGSIIGKSFSLDEFEKHVDSLTFGLWRPRFIVLHNTGAPSLKTYLGYAGHGVSDEQWMQNLAGYYKGQGWHAGPHLFCGPNKIMAFTPLTSPGVHSPSWNNISWGVEMIGDYDAEPFDSAVRDAAVSALATLHLIGGLDPSTLRFHKEDPGTTHKNCPGKNVSKQDMIARVVAAMKGEGVGDHMAERPTAEHHDANPYLLGSTRWVQFNLNRLGENPPLQVDGLYGGKTAFAVRRFQLKSNIHVDGLAGPETTRTIESAISAQGARP